YSLHVALPIYRGVLVAGAACSRRGDVLVDAEQVARVVVRLDRGQARVVVAVAGPDPFVALVHHHVHVRSAGRVRMQRLVVVDGPLADGVRVGRVRIHTGEDRAPGGVAVAPRGCGRRDVVDGAVDGIHVHGRLPGRQLR